MITARDPITPPWPLRCLRTRKGHLFLPWNLAALQAVIDQHPLRASDFELERLETRRLLRDLFVLSAQESLESRDRDSVGRLARSLLQRYHRQGGSEWVSG